MNFENGTISNSDIINLDSIIDNNGKRDNDIMDREFRTDMDESRTDININFKACNDDDLPNVIYRFKFTEGFMEELYKFSKIHQYDERKDFKEAWNIWTEENEDIINEETRRMNMLGYEGNVLDKMFKSARYYFRKKSTEKVVPKQRRQYISVNKELLNAMDNHIEENIYKKDYQPKKAFVSFCKENEKILTETITQIYSQGIRDSDLIEDKIKKTYKNRYFILTNNK
jgi:hypothetical protein